MKPQDREPGPTAGPHRRRHAPAARIRRLAWVLLLGGAVTGSAGAQTTESEDELAFVRRAVEDVTQSVTDLRAENAALREAFEREEQTLKHGDVTPGTLERARQATDASHSRVEAARVRLQTRRDALTEAEQQRDALAATLAQQKATEDRDPAAVAALEAELDKQTQLVSALEALTAALEQLGREAGVRAALARERFALLQGRFTYRLDAAADERAGPERQALKREVQRLIDEAARARSRVRRMGLDAGEGTERQRHLLDVEARAAEERAELAQMGLRLLRTESALRNLQSLMREVSVPLAALRTAAESTDALDERLAQEGRAVARLDRVVQGQLRTLGQTDPATVGLEAEREMVQEVATQVATQRERIDALRKRLADTREQLTRVLAERERAALTERRPLPPDAAGWKRLGRGLSSLPERVAAAVAQSLGTVWGSVRQAGAGALLQMGLLVVILVLGFLGLRSLAARIHRLAPDGVLSTPMEVLLAALSPALLLPLLWLGTGLLLGLPFSQLYLVLTLLLIWPAVRFITSLVRGAIEADRADAAAWEQLYRELRWVVTLGATLAALIVISRGVALSPAVLDALDRLSMLALLLAAIPALRLRATLVTMSKQAATRRVWHRIAAALSGLILLVIGGCALIGLLGYVNLGWSIARHLAWLALVTVAWLFVWTMFRDGMRSMIRRARERGESGEFWARNVLTPINNLAGLALLVLAGFVLVKIYGWTPETPGARWIYLAFNTPALTVGKVEVTVLSILTTVAIIFAVFWTGSWSKQVSYRWVYGRVADAGIRQSLSTFTQYLVVLFGLMIALKTIGLDLTALTVFAGALGVGIGFGLQNITSNFISGILLLVERPLRATDVVTVDQYEGEVTHIGIRSLSVKTFDNQEVIIPNSSVITKPFTNWTRGDDLMRTILQVGISYADDPNRAIEVVRDVVTAHEAVVATPAPKVLLWDFLDSSILIRAQFFSHVKGSVGRADLRSQILLEIWNAFRQAGITIPYPQRDVHFHAPPGSEASLPVAAPRTALAQRVEDD